MGEVILNRRGVKDDISHGIGRKKAASFAAVPEVIEQGKIVDYQRDWKDRGYDTAVVVAPVTIDGEPYFEGVILVRNKFRNNFYLHEVLSEIKVEGTAPIKTGAFHGSGIPSDAVPSVISLLQKVAEVKRNMASNDARFSIDEDGYMDALVGDYQQRQDKRSQQLLKNPPAYLKARFGNNKKQETH